MKVRAAALAFPLLLAIPFTAGAACRGADYRADYAAGRTSKDTKDIRDCYQSALHFVKRVVDGDTLRLSGGEKVRLIGVDTPETKHPRKPVEYYGPEAFRFTKSEIEKRYITMDFDREQRDRYCRLLAYVYRDPDDFFLNAELIRRGYGRAYTRFPFKRMQEFIALEREARDNRRGLWAGLGSIANSPASIEGRPH